LTIQLRRCGASAGGAAAKDRPTMVAATVATVATITIGERATDIFPCG